MGTAGASQGYTEAGVTQQARETTIRNQRKGVFPLWAWASQPTQSIPSSARVRLLSLPPYVPWKGNAFEAVRAGVRGLLLRGCEHSRLPAPLRGRPASISVYTLRCREAPPLKGEDNEHKDTGPAPLPQKARGGPEGNQA